MTSRPVEIGVAVLCLVLAGAVLFGLWHVVVGGILNGNGRAALFGIVLAVGAGSVLAGLVLVLLRLRRADRVP